MGSSIVLQWNVPTGVTHPINGWYILRSDSADGLFTPLLPDLTVVPVPDSGTTATYTDENVIVGKQYWYELEAVRQELPLADSSTPIINISPPETSSPAVAEGLTVPLPTSLQAGYAGYGRVGLSWSFDESSVPGLLGFDVYRYKGTGSTDPAGLSFIPTNATYLFGQDKQFEFYTDDNLDGSNAGYYFYRIVAAVDDGNGNEVYSAPSNVAVVDTTTNPSSAPAAPTLDKHSSMAVKLQLRGRTIHWTKRNSIFIGGTVLEHLRRSEASLRIRPRSPTRLLSQDRPIIISYQPQTNTLSHRCLASRSQTIVIHRRLRCCRHSRRQQSAFQAWNAIHRSKCRTDYVQSNHDQLAACGRGDRNREPRHVLRLSQFPLCRYQRRHVCSDRNSSGVGDQPEWHLFLY